MKLTSREDTRYLEDRVNDLEEEMSDVKLGLAIVADSVYEVQEVVNAQGQDVVQLQEKVCILRYI